MDGPIGILQKMLIFLSILFGKVVQLFFRQFLGQFKAFLISFRVLQIKINLQRITFLNFYFTSLMIFSQNKMERADRLNAFNRNLLPIRPMKLISQILFVFPNFIPTP